MPIYTLPPTPLKSSATKWTLEMLKHPPYSPDLAPFIICLVHSKMV
jgi:hypothetical protein